MIQHSDMEILQELTLLGVRGHLIQFIANFLNQKFLMIASVADAPRVGRPVSVTMTENTEMVALSYDKDANQSASRLSTALDISDRSLCRVLKRLKYHVYHPRLVHALHEDDFDRRLEFCEWYLWCAEEDPQFCQKILWTDEATFKFNAMVTDTAACSG